VKKVITKLLEDQRVDTFLALIQVPDDKDGRLQYSLQIRDKHVHPVLDAVALFAEFMIDHKPDGGEIGTRERYIIDGLKDLLTEIEMHNREKENEDGSKKESNSVTTSTDNSGNLH
jgi:hypothetical protein